ncbi:MAG: peptidase M23 [Halobacteriovorax sp.]|nr:peptidase M23 [Halobacteriovorax sp.]|tara:strand:+ start:73697 stop:74581 length:885 start_codon:yes stop_codon:yes gene_type:complete
MRYLILTFLLISGCASEKVIEIKAPVLEKQVTKPVSPKNYIVRPGELIFISFSDLREGKNGELLCKGKSIPFYRGKDGLEAFVAETYFSKLKGYHCIFKVGKKEHVVAHIEVKDKEFPSEKLKVAKKKIFPPKKALIRIRKEQKFLNKNYRSSPRYPLFVKSFKKPLDSFVTSIYGSKRLYNNKKQSQHLGTDYRAAVGTPIYSANSGKVVVGRDLYYTGNTVTLDHGLSIFTVYGHLSKLNVVEGDYVPKGALIGWAGATGRVTGPHLHWGVKVYGNWIEGDSLVEATRWLGE